MICWKCGYQNPDDGKFCQECGAQLKPGDAGGSQEESQLMVCWKCGHPNPEKNQFCDNCGASIWHADLVSDAQSHQESSQPQFHQESSQPQFDQESSQPQFHQESSHSQFHQENGQPQFRQSVGPESGISPIKIVALVFAAIYLFQAIWAIPSVFISIGGIFRGYHVVISISALLITVLGIISCGLSAGMLALFGMRRTKENEESLYLGVISVMALRVIVQIISMFWSIIIQWPVGGARVIGYLLIRCGWPLLLSVGVVAVLYVLFMIAGEKPFQGKTMDELKQMLKDLPGTIQKEMEQISNERSAGKAVTGQKTSTVVTGPNTLKTNWGLLKYILLSLITCGIYPFCFYYSIAKDINIICNGDGEQTAGLLKHVLLGIVTCGIYEYIWQYQFADRLISNAPRYGVTIQESGTTVLLWWILGSFCCGIGPFVALHIQTKNLNKMARAYNEGIAAIY